MSPIHLWLPRHATILSSPNLSVLPAPRPCEVPIIYLIRHCGTLCILFKWVHEGVTIQDLTKERKVYVPPVTTLMDKPGSGNENKKDIHLLRIPPRAQYTINSFSVVFGGGRERGGEWVSGARGRNSALHLESQESFGKKWRRETLSAATSKQNEVLLAEGLVGLQRFSPAIYIICLSRVVAHLD